jgi:hypothetical protein
MPGSAEPPEGPRGFTEWRPQPNRGLPPGTAERQRDFMLRAVAEEWHLMLSQKLRLRAFQPYTIAPDSRTFGEPTGTGQGAEVSFQSRPWLRVSWHSPPEHGRLLSCRISILVRSRWVSMRRSAARLRAQSGLRGGSSDAVALCRNPNRAWAMPGFSLRSSPARVDICRGRLGIGRFQCPGWARKQWPGDNCPLDSHPSSSAPRTVSTSRREVLHMPEQRQIGEKYWGVCWKWGFIPFPCRKTRRRA